MHSTFKRFREPIFVIALLAVPFVLFFVRAKKGRDLNPLDRAVIFVIAPAEKVITLAAFGVVDAWQAYGALRGVREDNLRLRRENLKANQLEQQATELKLENDRLALGVTSNLVLKNVVVNGKPYSLPMPAGK